MKKISTVAVKQNRNFSEQVLTSSVTIRPPSPAAKPLGGFFHS